MVQAVGVAKRLVALLEQGAGLVKVALRLGVLRARER